MVGCAFVDVEERRLIATASKDSVVRLWDVDSGACVAERIEDTSHSFTGMALVRDGQGESRHVMPRR